MINSINPLKFYNNLTRAIQLKGNAMEKLSSGKRINKASDDAAGLAITTKMRAQIRGLQQASRNIQDGISMLQVIDGALSEVTNYLQRMRELAVQGANGTLNNEDRQKINEEIHQIKSGIDSIANNTEFNTMKLLNGTAPYQGAMRSTKNAASGGITPSPKPPFDYSSVLEFDGVVTSDGRFQLKTKEGYPTTDKDDDQILISGSGITSITRVSIDSSIYHLRLSQITNTIREGDTYKTIYEIPAKNVEVTQWIKIVKDKYEIKYTVKNKDISSHNIGIQFNLDTQLGSDDGAPFIINGTVLENETRYNDNVPSSFIVYNQNTGAGANAEFQAMGILKTDGDYMIIEEPSSFVVANYDKANTWNYTPNNSTTKIADTAYSLIWNSRNITGGSSFEVNTFFGISIPPTIESPVEETPTTPPTEDMSPYMMLLQVGANTNNSYYIELFNATTKGLEIEGGEVNTLENSQNTINKIDKAIEKISSERGKFGAYTNGLEHLYSNTNSANHNLTSSESAIVDCDMAKESIALARSAIIENAVKAISRQSKERLKEVIILIQNMTV